MLPMLASQLGESYNLTSFFLSNSRFSASLKWQFLHVAVFFWLHVSLLGS
uniref:Uncharacterized protein n=1 Tax=Arundo donax TaxID=35708 RepID=A0A0A8Z0T1_ARUDO